MTTNLSLEMSETLEHVYGAMEGSEAAMAYDERHEIRSAAILTVYDDEKASLVADYLAERIEGKTVVEIGGGIGLLACHLALYAKRVYCIEANPAWAWSFVGCLYKQKPANLSYLFGAAQEFVGLIKADVAIICTHSDVAGMRELGLKFAPICIDVYGEIVGSNPAAFDALAVALRALDAQGIEAERPRPEGARVGTTESPTPQSGDALR